MSDGAPVRVAFRGALGRFRLDCAFSAPGQGVTALFGPSGCGKTTILRCIAGLQRMPGECVVGGRVWQDAAVFLPPFRRAVGYVFQEANLFGHLSVQANLLFGAPRDQQGSPGARAFEEAVQLLGLAGLLARSPRHLSGGERQRVAIGRALLSQPALLLMDEPLSALDAAARDEILPFVERLQESLAVPVLYVSHELAEVERLADHLVLLEAGRVTASGALAALQGDIGLPLAARRDAAVSCAGVVQGYDAAYGMVSVAVDGGMLLVPSAPVAVGARRRVRIAARDVSLATEPAASTILNVLPGRIVSVRAVDEAEMVARVGLGEGGGVALLSRFTRRSWDRLGLAEGAAVFAQVKAVALMR